MKTMKTMTNLMTKTINIGDLKPLQNLTVDIKIKGMKLMELRIKLSSLVFKFAAWIAGAKCKIEIEINKNEQPEKDTEDE